MEEGVEREDSERQVMVTGEGDNEGGDDDNDSDGNI